MTEIADFLPRFKSEEAARGRPYRRHASAWWCQRPDHPVPSGGL